VGTSPYLGATLIGTAQPGGTGVLPFATINGAELATYSAATGIQPYSAVGAAYVATVSGAAANANVRINASINPNDTATSKTINSLTLIGDVNLNIPVGVTLTIASGVILTTGTTNGATISGGGTLVLGEAIINTNPLTALTLT